MNQVLIQGSTVHYWVFNPNKPKTIVMIHGFRGTHHGLQNIIDHLGDYRIIIPDLPGFGASTPFTIKHTLRSYTNFIAEFLRLVAPKKPTLLGHSFGAILASHFAAEHPQAISKLILMNAIATPVLQGPRKLETKAALVYYHLSQKLPEKPGRALLSNPLIVMAASIFMTKTKDKALRKKIHQSHLTYFSTFQNPRTLNEAFDTSVKHTAADKAEEITVPTLLIAGEVDDIAPLHAQKMLVQKIPRAQLVVIKGAGHLTQHEGPIESADAIRAFVA